MTAPEATEPEATQPPNTEPEATEPEATEPDTTAAPQSTAPPSTMAPYTSAIYGDPAHWICRPDKVDLCDSDLDVTVVAPDGTTTVEPFVPATNALVDCFYLYPTTSEDQSMNSDFVPGQELNTTRVQAARFSEVCNVYAPVYRSLTLPALFGQVEGDRAAASQIAYGDALDAWLHYLSNDNGGRGVILIGHSQGSGVLSRLMREEIDQNEAVRSRLVSAYITGSSVAVPEGELVGLDLQEIPLCSAIDETGCVVTYMTFRSTAPPAEGAFFGRPRGGEGMSGCVNPAAPEGGSGVAHGAHPSGDWALTDRSLTPATFFMDLPGLVTAECRYENGYSYLELTIHSDLADPRADDIENADITPEWGTHLVDVQALSGNLLEMARQQIEAYTSS